MHDTSVRGDVTTRPMRLVLAVMALVGLLLASGCTAIKLGYQTMPTWGHFQLDRYWNLDSSQSELVKARLESFQDWHRSTELPQYARLLGGIKDKLRAGPVEPSEVARWREAAEGRWLTMAQVAAPKLAELAVTLRPEQLDRMKKRIAEQNVEHRKKVLPADPDKRQDNRAERIEERAETFFGRLNDAQREAIKRHVATVAVDDEAMYAERLARQQALVSVLERIVASRPSKDEARAQLEPVLAQMWKPRDAKRAALVEHTTSATDQLTANLVNAATPQQRAKMLARLEGWSGDFQQLASR